MGSKKSITDIIAKTDDGTIINIEAQVNKQEGFHKRSHFYHSKIFSILLEVSEDYEKLPKVIMINFLNFELDELQELEDYHTIFTLCEKKHKYPLDDITETHYIELPKFRKEVKNGNIDLRDEKTRLMLILDKKTDDKLFNTVIGMDEYTNNLYGKAKLLLQDKANYLAYIRAEQAELDRKAQIRYGEKTGEKRGEEKKAIEIAIKMKNNGDSIEYIAKITNLSLKTIEKL